MAPHEDNSNLIVLLLHRALSLQFLSNSVHFSQYYFNSPASFNLYSISVLIIKVGIWAVFDR